MLTLGAYASTWTSNAGLLQQELCVPTHTIKTWFAARVDSYTCMTIRTNVPTGPVFGSSYQSLARNPKCDPLPEPTHNGAFWSLEATPLRFLPRQEATMPEMESTSLASESMFNFGLGRDRAGQRGSALQPVVPDVYEEDGLPLMPAGPLLDGLLWSNDQAKAPRLDAWGNPAKVWEPMSSFPGPGLSGFVPQAMPIVPSVRPRHSQN